jgi:carbon storage regulator
MTRGLRSKWLTPRSKLWMIVRSLEGEIAQQGGWGKFMLLLTRRIGEEIVIGEDVRITVVLCHGKKVRLGVQAPASVRVDRKEVYDRRCGSAGRALKDPCALVAAGR